MNSSAGTTTLSYDFEDRVTGITYPSLATNSFTYNGLDTRVGKVDSSGSATYKRDGADVTDPVLSDGSALYTPGVSEHRGSATSFDHQDYLGTMTRQTNSSQSTTATRTYDAFGLLVASTGTPQGPFGYAGGWGYQQDSDSGLKLLGHRYYDPSTGRFLTRDPVKDGRNWYVYCGNSPMSLADPSGRYFIWVSAGASGQLPYVSGSFSSGFSAGSGGFYSEGSLGVGVGMGISGGASVGGGFDWTPHDPDNAPGYAVGITVLAVNAELELDDTWFPTGVSGGWGPGGGAAVYIERRLPSVDKISVPSPPDDWYSKMETAVRRFLGDPTL